MKIKRSAGLILLDIILQFFPGFMMYHLAAVVCQQMGGTRDYFSFGDGLLLLLFTASCYLIRYKIRNFNLFLVVQTGLFLLFCVILPNTLFARIVLIAVGFCRTFWDSMKRVGRMNEKGEAVNLAKIDMEAISPLEGCVPLLVLVVGLIKGNMQILYPFLVETSLFYVLYFFRAHLAGRRLYIEQYDRMTHFPLEQMKRTGYLVMSVYLGICVLCFTVAASFREILSGNGPFVWLWEKIRAILRFLFSLLPKSETPRGVETVTAETYESVQEGFVLPEAKETWVFWEFTEKILKVAVAVLLLVLLVKGIQALYRELKGRFQSRKQEEREAEDVQEKLVREGRPPQKRRRGGLFLPSEEKIRKIYRRTIKKAVPQKSSFYPYRTMNPEQLHDTLKMQELVEEEVQMRNLYEKARYSGKTMENDELEQMKKAAKWKR